MSRPDQRSLAHVVLLDAYTSVELLELATFCDWPRAMDILLAKISSAHFLVERSIFIHKAVFVFCFPSRMGFFFFYKPMKAQVMLVMSCVSATRCMAH